MSIKFVPKKEFSFDLVACHSFAVIHHSSNVVLTFKPDVNEIDLLLTVLNDNEDEGQLL